MLYHSHFVSKQVIYTGDHEKEMPICPWTLIPDVAGKQNFHRSHP